MSSICLRTVLTDMKSNVAMSALLCPSATNSRTCHSLGVSTPNRRRAAVAWIDEMRTQYLDQFLLPVAEIGSVRSKKQQVALVARCRRESERKYPLYSGRPGDLGVQRLVAQLPVGIAV